VIRRQKGASVRLPPHRQMCWIIMAIPIEPFFPMNDPQKYYSYKIFIDLRVSENPILWNNQGAARIRTA
jgi:hypothetical protein